MHHRIFKSGVGEINLPDLSGRKGVQHFGADGGGVRKGRFAQHIGIIRHNVPSPAFKRVHTFSADTIDVGILRPPSTVRDQPDDIIIVSSGKPPAGSDHNDRPSGGTVGGKVRVVDLF